MKYTKREEESKIWNKTIYGNCAEFQPALLKFQDTIKVLKSVVRRVP